MGHLVYKFCIISTILWVGRGWSRHGFRPFDAYSRFWAWVLAILGLLMGLDTLDKLLVEVGQIGIVTVGRFDWSLRVLRFNHMDPHWVANPGRTESLD